MILLFFMSLLRIHAASYASINRYGTPYSKFENRESYFKIMNTTFANNENIPIYINLTKGEHKVLRSEGALSTFCLNTSECIDLPSISQHLCVATRRILIAAKRDPSVPVCGECLPSYHETTCVKCVQDGMSNECILPVRFLIYFGVVCLFFLMGKREHTASHPAITYASKTLLFFYQVLPFLTFRSPLQVIKPLAELVNFNFDVSETFLFRTLNSRQKLWLHLSTPGIITFNLTLLSVGVFIKHMYRRRKNKFNKKDWKDDKLAMQSAFWDTFMIIYVQITSALIQVSICYPFGGTSYMWYAGAVECHWQHAFSIAACVILIFIVPFGMFRAMKCYKQHHPKAYTSVFAPLTLAYNDKFDTFYEPFNVFRRAILIVLPSVPTYELSVRAALSAFAMGALLFVHDYLIPFKHNLNNHLETFVLLNGFFISTLNITDDAPIFFPYLIAILAIMPLVPLIPLFYDFARAKSQTLKEKLIYEDQIDNEETNTSRSGAISSQSTVPMQRQKVPSIIDDENNTNTNNYFTASINNAIEGRENTKKVLLVRLQKREMQRKYGDMDDDDKEQEAEDEWEVIDQYLGVENIESDESDNKNEFEENDKEMNNGELTQIM